MGVGAVITGSRRAVFLDRDGVLNRTIIRARKPYPPSTLNDLEIYPEAAACLERLRRSDFLLLVITNQPDVARGVQSASVVEEMHRRLALQLPVDDFFVCYHDDADHCACRKPRPGLLLQAAEKHGVSLTTSFVIGDRWRDIDAGNAAGCRTIWIDHGYDERPPASPPSARVNSLTEAVEYISTATQWGNTLRSVTDLKVKLFADGADKATMLGFYSNPCIKGFTTNPTLMRKAGITDYEAFARDILTLIQDRPISFEVLADEFGGMERQAVKIAAWGDNVYVKIPITNTQGESSVGLIRKLTITGVKVNVTALLTINQVRDVADALSGGAPSYVSVFAGRVADTGIDPLPLMTAAVEALRGSPNAELIWASPREVLNVFQADSIGCHIITATSDILKKLYLAGKDLHEYSRETVQMFHADSVASGFLL